MNYVTEALLVGVYSWFIYLLFSPFVKNFYMLLLVVGFSKHFLGSSFKIHDLYCNTGEACVKVLSQDDYYQANTKTLIRDSAIESILYLILGFLLSYQLTKDYLFFVIGFTLHILAEYLFVHKHFCKNACDVEQTN
jgi:hypothetical protein